MVHLLSAAGNAHSARPCAAPGSGKELDTGSPAGALGLAGGHLETDGANTINDPPGEKTFGLSTRVRRQSASHGGGSSTAPQRRVECPGGRQHTVGAQEVSSLAHHLSLSH